MVWKDFFTFKNINVTIIIIVVMNIVLPPHVPIVCITCMVIDWEIKIR